MCRYCASKVGTYSLAVTSSREGEHLAGSPFQFDVTPGQLSPCHCTATLASAALVAGEEAAVGIDAKDMHGNQARFSGFARKLCLSMLTQCALVEQSHVRQHAAWRICECSSGDMHTQTACNLAV